MSQSSTRSKEVAFLLPDVRTAITTGFTAAVLLTSSLAMQAQSADTGQAAQPPAATAPAGDTAPAAKPDITLESSKAGKKKKVRKEDKVVESKDTRQENKKLKKDNPLVGVDAKLPDKQLYDKAQDAIKHGRYDVGRLDLQTLLNTYPDSQFMMRAKLAIADSWYKEGGTAALTQAEQEYKDFITFFPNSPEAAEAQMRVGDIYFKQMDKPDRDYSKTLQAEQEYQLMLQQFPDSPLVPQARQRLREVQEVLASRDASIGQFYAERQPPDVPGAIARYQTVVDTYPLYSHMDDVLIGLGDLYEMEAKAVRGSRLPEAAKAQLEKVYDDQAASAYRKVVLEHSAAPHVEDAKDRLVAMNLPVPTPTPEEAAASTALENSRGQYSLSKRATLLFLRKADTVPAATVGDPPLEDAKQTVAPTVVRKAQEEFKEAINPAARPAHAAPAAAPGTEAAAAPGTGSAAPAAGSAAPPLAFQEVPSEKNAEGGSTESVQSAPAATSSGTGSTGVGVEIVQPRSGQPAPAATPGSTAFPGSDNAAPAQGAAPAQTATPPADQTGGIGPVGPPNATPLAPIEKPAAAPEAVNEAKPGEQPPAQTAPANGKKPKPSFDKSEESSSKHKKKKGLGKVNPF